METKRIIVFLCGCILARTLLVLMAKKLDKKYVKIMGYIALLIGLSFMYLYFIGNAGADSQLEWLGDKKIWWNELRPVHGALYLLFALFAIKQKEYSWVFLLIDVIVGLVSWLIHHKILNVNLNI
jgi:hypothetical protein